MSPIEVGRPPKRSPLLLRVIDRASAVAALVAGLALVSLILNVAVDVILRATDGRPLGRTLEMTTYWWMPLLITLSYAITEREREHITVTMLLDRMPTRSRQYVEGAFSAVGAAVVAALTWYTILDAVASTEIRLAANSTPPLEYWPAKILAAIGLSLFTLQMAATTFRHLTGRSTFADDLTTEADAV
jgi:TRAP-type C4-dicarboxylate transport system permease small subunit